MLDDDTLLVDEPSHEIGEIKMSIDRVSILGKEQPSFFPELPEIDKVHERCAKKAVTHKVSSVTFCLPCKSLVGSIFFSQVWKRNQI
jgi:hypothetical protein